MPLTIDAAAVLARLTELYDAAPVADDRERFSRAIDWVHSQFPANQGEACAA